MEKCKMYSIFKSNQNELFDPKRNIQNNLHYD